MTKQFKSLAAATLLALASSASQATAIGAITHNYGTSGDTSASTGATSCDTLNASSITVTNKSSCARFLDSFDFSKMAYTAIDSFTLSLNFSGTNNLFENWGVRPASSAFNGSSVQPSLTRSAGATSQSFTFTNLSNPDVFNAIVSSGSFYLWFASNGLGQQAFAVNSATLTVNGTAAAAVVPEPASIALLGLAALGFGAARRRRQKAA